MLFIKMGLVPNITHVFSKSIIYLARSFSNVENVALGARDAINNVG